MPGQLRAGYACRAGRALGPPRPYPARPSSRRHGPEHPANVKPLPAARLRIAPGKPSILPTGSPRTMRGLVAGGRRFPGATNTMTFETLGLSHEMLPALSEHGYTPPNPNQTQAIPPAPAGPALHDGAPHATS